MRSLFYPCQIQNYFMIKLDIIRHGNLEDKRLWSHSLKRPTMLCIFFQYRSWVFTVVFCSCFFQQFAEYICSGVNKTSMDFSSSFLLRNFSEAGHSRYKCPSLCTKLTLRDGLLLEWNSFLSSFTYHLCCFILSRPHKIGVPILIILFSYSR